MRWKTTTIAFWVSAGVLLAALFLLAMRGGLIAWVAGIAAALLLAKQRWRPSQRDAGYALVLTALATVAWLGTFFYVISTYESGEVVELAIDTESGPRTVRLWVMEIYGEAGVYIDAEPEIAASLLAGKPLQVSRAGVATTRVPRARPIDGLSNDETEAVLEAMVQKYGSRMTASDLYYVLLGRPRDRVALFVSLPESGAGR
jgi:hypothetical protein